MQIETDDCTFMRKALQLAEYAEKRGEVPIGAVLVLDNKVIAEGWNCPITTNDPTAHAEVVALRKGASILGNYRLLRTTLYVTVEPCAMCVGALIHARVERVVFGAYDQKAGAVASAIQLADNRNFNHHFSWQGGILEDECGSLLSDFFKKKRR